MEKFKLFLFKKIKIKEVNQYRMALVLDEKKDEIQNLSRQLYSFFKTLPVDNEHTVSFYQKD